MVREVRDRYRATERQIRTIGNRMLKDANLSLSEYRVAGNKVDCKVKVLNARWYDQHGRHMTFRMSPSVNGVSDYHSLMLGNYPPVGLFGYKRRDRIVRVVIVDIARFRQSVEDDVRKRTPLLTISHNNSNNPFVSLRIPDDAVMLERDLSGECADMFEEVA